MSERQRRAAAADAAARFRKFPMWVAEGGEPYARDHHPNLVPCRWILDHEDAPQVVPEWLDPTAFVYGSTAAFGLRPTRFHYLLPVDYARPLGPGNGRWVLANPHDRTQRAYAKAVRDLGEAGYARLEAADAAYRLRRHLAENEAQPAHLVEDGGSVSGRSSPLLDCLCDLAWARQCGCLLAASARLDFELPPPGQPEVGVPPGWVPPRPPDPPQQQSAPAGLGYRPRRPPLPCRGSRPAGPSGDPAQRLRLEALDLSLGLEDLADHLSPGPHLPAEHEVDDRQAASASPRGAQGSAPASRLQGGSTGSRRGASSPGVWPSTTPGHRQPRTQP